MAEERPRDRIYSFAIDRLASLNARSIIECKEPRCGQHDEDGELPCATSAECGEKLMKEGWRRELQVMRDIKALVEFLENREIAEKDTSRKVRR